MDYNEHVDQEDDVKTSDSVEESEKEALIDALTAIASAISFCDSAIDMGFANERSN